MRLILVVFFALSISGHCDSTIYGSYKTILDFPRHPMWLSLKIKKNGKYKFEKSATTIHPNIKVIGEFEIRNDSLLLFPKYYYVGKHRVNNYKKQKYQCDKVRDFSSCDIDVLLITIVRYKLGGN